MIKITTNFKRLLADVYTPVAIYLRVRDQFRDAVLLESADYQGGKNSFSFIGIHAIAGIEITDFHRMEYKVPHEEVKKTESKEFLDIPYQIKEFMDRFQFNIPEKEIVVKAQQLFGYTSYESILFKEEKLRGDFEPSGDAIPLMRYRLYQYVIIINHFSNDLYLCENHIEGLDSHVQKIESLIKSHDLPTYPFSVSGEAVSNLNDKKYIGMVKKGIQHCARGDVFQIVLSRSFSRAFQGDEFNVYRALRNINPSPYLFFFDYGNYRLFGSSPEAQIIAEDGVAVVHPIAGTFRRTGNDEQDESLAQELLKDEKENAEHVMLVDLARNDLSRVCEDVSVSKFSEIQFFSHVIHLVSEVKGILQKNVHPIDLLMATFPAGTLSGAPKVKAMELISRYELNERSYYGGCIGAIGFDGSINHAIIIRTILSRKNQLHYRAGAGITINSNPESEMQEVNNKLNALTAAITAAQKSEQ